MRRARGAPPGRLTDQLRSRLAREWVITVEVVTPAPDDEPACARILALADAVRDDRRVAALTLTDRTVSPAADPVTLAPSVAEHAGAAPLVHLAGKGRDARQIEDALRRCAAAGVGSVLLTGGDVERSEAREPAGEARERAGEARERAGEAREPASSIDAVQLIRLASASTPAITRLGVLMLPSAVRGAVSWERAAAKREAGADAFVAQVSWDLAERTIVAEWQARLGAPIIGAVLPLTQGRLRFLTENRIGGIVVPPALRARVAAENPEIARRRLALDLVLLRRLGYAGAHVSGILTPSLLASVLDEADRLQATLGDDWRDVWRTAVGIT